MKIDPYGIGYLFNENEYARELGYIDYEDFVNQEYERQCRDEYERQCEEKYHYEKSYYELELEKTNE